MDRRMRLAIALGAAVLFAQAWIGTGKAHAAEKVTIRFGLQTPWEATTDQLIAARILEAAFPQTIKVELNRFLIGPPIIRAMQTGDLDVGFFGEGAMLHSLAQNMPFRIVASVTWAKSNHALVVLKNASYNSPKDLEGKTSAILANTTAHQLLMEIQKASGMRVGAIKHISMPPKEALSAFLAGRVDSTIVWGFLIPQLMSEGKARIIADGRGNNFLTAAGVLVTADFIKKHPVATRRLVEAWILAQQFVMDHIVAASARYLDDEGAVKLPLEVAVQGNQLSPRWPDVRDPEVSRVYQYMADFFSETRFLPRRLDFAAEPLVDPQFVTEASKRGIVFPFSRGSAAAAPDWSEKDKDLAQLLAPYVAKLRSADPEQP